MVFALLYGSATSVIAFIVICLALLASLLMAVWMTITPRTRATRATVLLAGGLALYVLTIAGIVLSGIFEKAFVPFGPMFLVVTIAAAVSLGFSPLGNRISAGISLPWLVGFQSFRLPLEVVLHDWYQTGTIPESMTWTGSNWDIFSGIVALAFFPFVARSRALAWIANVVGIVLLVNVVRVAILSSPVPFGWDVEPKLELIAYLPYAFIVPICVGGAALGHVLLTRRLLGFRVGVEK
ncbi:MAG: hypothetical protein ABI557_07620 [Aureliella sp.]